MATIGDKFTVRTESAVKDSRERVLANYLPGMSYRVTPRNLQIVNKMVNDGVADLVAGDARPGAANQLSTGSAQLRATMSTN